MQVQKDAKYVRNLMFLLWLWLWQCHMIRWTIAAHMMYSFFNCWQTHMWSGVFSRSLTREKTLRIWMLLCHLQSGENTNILLYQQWRFERLFVLFKVGKHKQWEFESFQHTLFSIMKTLFIRRYARYFCFKQSRWKEGKI